MAPEGQCTTVCTRQTTFRLVRIVKIPFVRWNTKRCARGALVLLSIGIGQAAGERNRRPPGQHLPALNGSLFDEALNHAFTARSDGSSKSVSKGALIEESREERHLWQITTATQAGSVWPSGVTG